VHEQNRLSEKHGNGLLDRVVHGSGRPLDPRVGSGRSDVEVMIVCCNKKYCVGLLSISNNVSLVVTACILIENRLR